MCALHLNLCMKIWHTQQQQWHGGPGTKTMTSMFGHFYQLSLKVFAKCMTEGIAAPYNDSGLLVCMWHTNLSLQYRGNSWTYPDQNLTISSLSTQDSSQDRQEKSQINNNKTQPTHKSKIRSLFWLRQANSQVIKFETRIRIKPKRLESPPLVHTQMLRKKHTYLHENKILSIPCLLDPLFRLAVQYHPEDLHLPVYTKSKTFLKRLVL